MAFSSGGGEAGMAILAVRAAADLRRRKATFASVQQAA
jgi:hypothetical protein